MNHIDPAKKRKRDSLSLSPEAFEFIDRVADALVLQGATANPKRSTAADLCILYAAKNARPFDIANLRGVLKSS